MRNRFLGHRTWSSLINLLNVKIGEQILKVNQVLISNPSFMELVNNDLLRSLQMNLTSLTFLTSCAQRPQFYEAVSKLCWVRLLWVSVQVRVKVGF